MPSFLPDLLLVSLGALVGAGGCLFCIRRGMVRGFAVHSDLLERARSEAGRIEQSARLAAQELESAAARNVAAERAWFDGWQLRYRRRLRRVRQGYRYRLDEVGETQARMERRTLALERRERGLALRSRDLEVAMRDQREALARISGLSVAEASRRLEENIYEEVQANCAQALAQVRQRASEQADEAARVLVIQAMERCAAQYTAEHAVTVVPIRTEGDKGRIIGRAGRNIRAFESATGVDLIVDDQPDCLVLSGYDPVKREIARRSLEILLADGRVTPEAIDTVVVEQRQELDRFMVNAAQQVVDELGLVDLHPELIRYLGRLRFRTSYTQNVLLHSQEVAYLADYIATELGLGFSHSLTRRAGLLHDIGKAVDHNAEGSHAELGVEMARKYGEPPEVCRVIEGHHLERTPDDILPSIVAAADAISGSRPGARRQNAAQYVHRLEQLEDLATGFRGVERAYAIQAGREVRVIVQSDVMDDADSAILADRIARKVSTEMRFPGEIRVTVIRETRVVAHAR